MLGTITCSKWSTPGQPRAHRHASSTLITSARSVTVQMSFPGCFGGPGWLSLSAVLGASLTPGSARLSLALFSQPRQLKHDLSELLRQKHRLQYFSVFDCRMWWFPTSSTRTTVDDNPPQRKLSEAAEDLFCQFYISPTVVLLSGFFCSFAS